MTTPAEIFAAQYEMIDKLIPEAVLVQEWAALRKRLAFAKLSGNKLDEMRMSAPGFAISIIKELLILRAFSKKVDTVFAKFDVPKEGEPHPVIDFDAALSEIGDALSELTGRYRKFADEKHPENVEKADGGDNLIIMPKKG